LHYWQAEHARPDNRLKACRVDAPTETVSPFVLIVVVLAMLAGCAPAVPATTPHAVPPAAAAPTPPRTPGSPGRTGYSNATASNWTPRSAGRRANTSHPGFCGWHG